MKFITKTKPAVCVQTILVPEYDLVIFPQARQLIFSDKQTTNVVAFAAIDNPHGLELECTPVGRILEYKGLTAARMAELVGQLDLRDGGLLVLFK